jgi:4-hydroxybenzoyl-CoA reductase subunit alpha
VSIDRSQAESLAAVHAVVTGADMPVPYCIIPWTRDETALCVDRVRFIGDGVAASRRSSRTARSGTATRPAS